MTHAPKQPAAPSVDVTRVESLLGRPVPSESDAWSSAMESLAYRDETEAAFDLAETMACGPARDGVLQEAHNAVALAEDWEGQAIEDCGRLKAWSSMSSGSPAAHRGANTET